MADPNVLLKQRKPGMWSRLFQRDPAYGPDLTRVSASEIDFSASDDAKIANVEEAAAELHRRFLSLAPGEDASNALLKDLQGALESARIKNFIDAQHSLWAAEYRAMRAVSTKRLWVRRLLIIGLSPLATAIMLLALQYVVIAQAVLPFGREHVDLYLRCLWIGALGGTTAAFWGLVKHTTDLDFEKEYIIWYWLKPSLGAISAVFSVLVVQAGFLNLSGNLKQSTNILLYVLAFVAGFSERFFIQTMDRVITAIFGGSDGQSSASTLPKSPKLAITPPPATQPASGQQESQKS